MKQSETVATTSHRVFQAQMNDHDSLFGGQTASWLDEAASVTAHRYSRAALVTASVDTLQYFAPILLGDAVTYITVVSGAGTKSFETFTRLIGESKATGERYLAGIAFMTFVATDGNVMRPLECDTEFGRTLNAGYAARKAANKAGREALPDIPID